MTPEGCRPSQLERPLVAAMKYHIKGIQRPNETDLSLSTIVVFKMASTLPGDQYDMRPVEPATIRHPIHDCRRETKMHDHFGNGFNTAVDLQNGRHHF